MFDRWADRGLKLATLVSAVGAILAAVFAWPLDTEIKKLQADTSRVELGLKQAEANLKASESSRKLAMDLYQEVRKVLQAEKSNPREEEALRVLVESVAEEPFREKLLNALAVGAKAADVRKKAGDSAKFFSEGGIAPSASVLAGAASSVSSATGMIKSVPIGLEVLKGLDTFNVDFFYCEHGAQAYKDITEKAAMLRAAEAVTRWRSRMLPDSINRQPGYSLHGNIIRHNREESIEAGQLAELLKRSFGIEMRLEGIDYPTPGYLSAFFCG